MLSEETNKMLKNTDRSLIEVYLELQKKFEKEYGETAVVLMEVGSFFEVYGVDNEEEKIGKPKEIAEILNLQLTRKNKSIIENSAKNPLMAGFPGAAFDRYIQRLIQEQRYVIIIIRQKGTPPNVTRYLDQIISPGINFDYSLDHDDNFIASVVIDRNKEIYSVGFAAIDVTIGKTVVTEIHGTSEDPMFALDQLFQLLQTYRTSELVITRANDAIGEADIVQYLELYNDTHVRFNIKRQSIQYQNSLFKEAYGIESQLEPVEYLNLERTPLTSEALTLLLDVVIQHDYTVVQELCEPEHIQDGHYLYLGNNPLEQLNIVSQNMGEYTVAKLIDHTSTSIGRRLLQERLLHPITNANELKRRYALVEELTDQADDIQAELKAIYDIERIARRITLRRLHPFEINFLYDSLVAVQAIMKQISKGKEHPTLREMKGRKEKVDQCISVIQKIFDLDQTTRMSVVTIEKSFFKKGFNAELDALVSKKNHLEEQLELVRSSLIALLKKETGKEEEDYVQVKKLDKEGHYLHMTKSRYFLIEEKFKEAFVKLEAENSKKEYALSDFVVKVQTTNVKITAPVTDAISEKIIIIESKITALVKELYEEQLLQFNEQFAEILRQVIADIASIDVAISTVQSSRDLRLVQPEILTEVDTAMLQFTDLRHLLVEQREENGIYVPNDLQLGNSSSDDIGRGILLYGINSSGKSSLMKSVGIAVVLAQSGFYVPATEMKYTIVKELFTRIVSRDHFEKGLSSFAVEMIELRNIFNRCSPQSLILGDEISHGTETISAISIVGAAVDRLLEMKPLFMFATHLHQVLELPEAKKWRGVVSMHLAVHYDNEIEALVFDRKLQPGSGSNMYGLEFAQSLDMDDAFIQKALDIRKTLARDFHDLEMLTKKETSKYSKELYLTSCAICADPVDDTHHIEAQQLADENGNIEHFHKDHKKNLIPLCKSCHQKVHARKIIVEGYVMSTKGMQLKYQDNRE